MPISFDVGADSEEAGFSPDEVLIQFVCQTGPGEHDPDGVPDERVRPSHAALHGTVWRMDDPAAPIPPLDFGCRCSIRYLSKPGTTAERVLPPAESEPVTDPAKPAKDWLNANAKGWEKVADAVAEAEPQEAIQAANKAADAAGLSRPIARLILDVQPARAPGPSAAGPLAGLGRAGRALVEAWRLGDLTAARKLQLSYPATFARLLREEGLPVP
jgi:hypothetical protein